MVVWRTVKRIFLATAAQSAISTILLAYSAIGHCGEDDAFSRWATAHAVPLATVEPSEDFSDLLPLESVIGTAPVVALGEPTHDAHEPLAFRNRLIRFLVEQRGFTAVALEMGFTDSASVDSFVGGAPADARSVIADVSAQQQPPYVENAQLIQWMRDYNGSAAAAGHHRIRFYGIDLTFGGRVGGPRRVIGYALTYLSRANPAEADRIRLSLDDNLPPTTDSEWGMLSQPALAALDSALPAIAKAMAKNRGSLIADSSVEEYRWALHNLDVGRELAKCFHLTTPQSFTDMRYAGPVVGCRDQAMAENVRWIVRNEGSRGRVLVFAHNGHIMNAKQDGGFWAEMQEKPFMMGSYLRHAFGKRLLIIATSSATSSAGLPTPEPIKDSIDDALARVGPPKFFLDLRTARQDPGALAWLSTQRPWHANIITHFLVTPSGAADVFVYLGGLTPAILPADKEP